MRRYRTSGENTLDLNLAIDFFPNLWDEFYIININGYWEKIFVLYFVGVFYIFLLTANKSTMNIH